MSVYLSGIATPNSRYYFPFHDSHQWSVYSGYAPKIQGWVIPADTAQKILLDLAGLTGEAREVVLFFGEPNDPIFVERVVVVGAGPADNLQRRTLLVTDVRFYLLFSWMVMDVNVRRRVGDKRLVGGTLQDETPVDAVAYASWSLNGEDPFDWDSFKEQGLTYLTTARHGRPAIQFVTDEFVMTDVTSQVVQETTNDSDGIAALGRVIESVPGARIYVDLSGVIHVFDGTPGAERELVEQLPPDLLGHGTLALVDYSPFRPVPSASSWRIYVDWEIEVCWAYDPEIQGDLLDVADPGNPLSVFSMQPVLQVTDLSLDIPSGGWGEGRTVGAGTWITQDEAFAAWGGVGDLPQLTDDMVADHYMGDGLESYQIFAEVDGKGPEWHRRIDELFRCWRTYFRFNPTTWERVRHSWMVRASVWDPATGTRAPAPVYCNFHVAPITPLSDAEAQVFGYNVENSYPDSGNVVSDGKPSGFRVELVDEELGIIAITRDARRVEGAQEITVSPVETIAEISEADGAVLDPSLQTLWHTDQWKLAVIVSCSPAAPNDLGRLFEIQVSTSEAAEAAGLLSPEEVIDGSAPDQELRTQIADARGAWLDDGHLQDEIVSLFGADDDIPKITLDDPVDIVPINLDQELQPLGNAVAAADLLNKLDRYEGTKAVPANSELAPIGSITSVVHKVTEDRFVSVVHCDPAPPPYAVEDFLSGSSRSYLLKQIAARR